jgi:putative phosphoribosyl transferase
MDIHIFADRTDAGRRLGRLAISRLEEAGDRDKPVVLALPRGGVQVAVEVADALSADLDVTVARKIGAPGHPELAVGAVTADGPVYWNEMIMNHLRLTPHDVQDIVLAERAEAARRLQRYRGDRPTMVSGRTAIVVDDGLATGATAIAALRDVRTKRPRRLILAVPVGAPDTISKIQPEADEIWSLQKPARLMSVGEWYADFPQLTDDEVDQILAAHGTVKAGRR